MPTAPLLRPFRSIAAILFAVACVPGCGRAPEVAVDLTDLLPLAQLATETRSIDFGTPEARHHLVAGWSFDEVTAGGRSFVWGEGDASRLRLVVGEPRDLEIRFRCWPLRYAGAPAQRLTLRVGGKPVTQRELAPAARWYTVQVPGALLVPGENRLELRYSHHARRRDVVPESRDARPLAVAWDVLQVHNARSYGLPSADRRGEVPALRLPFHASATYYALLPAGGGLDLASIAAWGDAPAGQLEVDVRVADAAQSQRSQLAVGKRAVQLALPASAEGPVAIGLRAVHGGTAPAGPAGLDLMRPTLRVPGAEAPPPARTESREPPNVVIYLIDTLRADHLGVYGYPRPTSPHIDSFAQDGVVFRFAIAQSPWTRPSVASLFTGLNPQSHGVVRPDQVIPGQLAVLPELFSALGYRTFGVVTNGNVHGDFGFGRGFDGYRYLPEQEDTVDFHQLSDRVNEIAFRWLERKGRDRPFFLYLHTTDPHGPYRPRAPFRERFAPDVSDPEVGGRSHIGRLREGEGYRPGVEDQLRALYDGEIAFNDASFGAFLAKLRELDLYEGSLIVLLSDHGEAFAEHGTWVHGTTLYEEEIRVPLIVKLPHGRFAGHSVTQLVRQIDLLPTLLEVAGGELPPHVEGRSLLPLLDAGRAVEDPAVALSHLDRRRGDWESVVQLGRKLIRTRAREGGAERIRLFDLQRDPGEGRDLAEERPVWRGYLLSQLKRQQAIPPPAGAAPEVELEEGLRQRLEALGYL